MKDGYEEQDAAYMAVNNLVIDNLAEENLYKTGRKNTIRLSRYFVYINEDSRIQKAKEGSTKHIKYLDKKYSLKVYTKEQIEEYKRRMQCA